MVPGYEVLECLGLTAGSRLCRGRRLADRRPVLLKLLEADPATPDQVTRFRREHELLDSLNRPGIPRPLTFVEGPRPAIVLEDCGGELLEAALASPLPLPRALRLSQQLAQALAGLHEAQVIHRDLRPANLLVGTADAHVCLVDLSRAAPRDAPAGPATGDGALEGDPAYISPEQTGRMHHPVDHRTDLYSLGVILHRMFSGGVLPFQAGDPLEWVHCHLARTPVLLTEVVPGLPRAIADIVMKLLAKPPEDRYQSARGLALDLTRCLAQWETTGRIESFPPGEHDVADRIQVPRKLYGREREVEELLQAYDRVATRRTAELVLVSGYSGIGKSSLVQEMHKSIVRERGFFGSGKFDQYKRDIPYATILQAFRELVLGILAESEPQIAAWRARLLTALGINAQVIVDVIPPVELVIGRQPPVPELPPIEAQNRFRSVFRQFVGVFAQKEHPLVLFLDDLQWADSASLGLLEELVAHPDMHHLLIVGAYRDNEVTPAHPLMLVLDEVRNAGALVSHVLLGPLSRRHLATFISDTLHCRREEAAPLSDLIYEKTAGNPFFAIQFLRALHEERLIEFDAPAQAFRWDVTKIRAKGFTDNVVELMIGKLRRLPAAAQEALKQLACLGNSADVALLTMVLGRSEQETHADLWEAARGGLVLHLDGAYRFLHDRIQEAAYSLIPEDLRAEVHLRIGRILVSRLSENELAERVFDVANQLNRGAHLLTDPREKETLFRLDLLSGKKAKAAIAYASARNYLAQATSLLPPDAWSARYDDTFPLYLLLSECEYLVGNFQRADELFDLILRNAHSNPDRARAYRLRMRLYQIAGRFNDAVTVTLEAVRLFGMTTPESDEEIQVATEAEMRQVPIHLRGRPIADLVDAPVATDESVRAIIGLLAEAMPLVYTGRPALWPLITVKGVNLCLQYGHAEESSFVYSCYAMVLVGISGDIPRALQFSEMSIRLNEQFKSSAATLRGKLLFHHGAVVNFWSKHFAMSLPLLEQAFLACLDVGDLVCAGYLTYNQVWLVFENGDPLDHVIEVAQKYTAFARQSHNDVVYQVVRVAEQLAASLRGATRELASFDDDTFDEAHCVAFLEEAGFGLGIAYYHVAKQVAAFIHERYAEALESAASAALMLRAVASLAPEATHHFYHALTLTAIYPQASVEQQPELARTLQDKLRKLKLWADNCPENFGNRHALVAAEVARVEGRDLDAQHLYEAAIRSAHENDFVQNEAIACELASRFYRSRGFERIADIFIREARACYARWGADGKVKQLDQQYPHLFEPKPLASTATLAVRAEQLDLLTVLKASQAISGQIVLDELVKTLMRVVLENAGAQTAALLLARGNDLAPATVASVDGQGVSVCRREEDEALSPSELPLSILNYVRHSRERVLLSDATQPNPFAADEYLVRRQPKSILCLPIVRQAELIGVLYLENNLVTHAFTPDRLAMLELLAGQAAISLENAQLYTDLQRENSERRQAEAALWESQALLQGIIDTSTALIYVKDLDGRHLLVNRRLAELVHLEPAAMLGKTDHELYPSAQADTYRAFDLRVIAAGTALEAEDVLSQEDGIHTFISIKAPLTDAAGVPYALCGISTDITERKRLEQQLQQSQKLESIGQLAGGVAHDFNNLLTAILGYTGFVEEALEPGHPVFPDLEQIRQAGERAAGLTRQLLAFARRQVIEPRMVDLNGVVLDLEKMLRRLIGEDIELSTVPAPGLWPVKADPGQLEQVVVNLAVNARDAMPAGGILTIATATLVLDEAEAPEHPEISAGEYVLLVVKDTGTGMTEEVKAHVFEPFYTTKEVGKGTGLGLATCYGIVRQNRGHIELVSEVGKGTTFTVYLPRALGVGDVRVRQGVREAVARSRGHETVLVVEDDPRVRDFIVRVLGSQGYRVLEAVDGEDALRLVQATRGPIHVLLTDVVMPKMGGKELAERLQALRPALQVLYMSGYAQGALADPGALDRGMALLQKPFTPQMLAQRMREVLDRVVGP
jgi:PAS domain S-box-containing protein